MAGDHHHDYPRGRPSWSDLKSNWTETGALTHVKMKMVVTNLWRRVVLRQSCCGNHGQPGC